MKQYHSFFKALIRLRAIIGSAENLYLSHSLQEQRK